ncbi:MAG: patatin-like phospholipase family protein [Proteobacteria bacterium]|nr:patatin-like phospholipase family protein [Pseudomonadota bacterium]
MNSALEPDSLRIKQASEAVNRLVAADPPPGLDSIHEAALECFEAGAPAEASKLLAHFAGHGILAPTITKTAWFIRFQSWLDAAKAEDLLAEKPQFTAGDTKTILSLAKRLRNASQFGLSRRLLARLAGEREDLLAEPAADAEAQTTFAILLLEKYTKVIQDLSLSTYKDLDLHPARSLAEAERLLGKIGLRKETCADPETLGQGGAVFKRRWELTGRLEHLQQSLAFYRRGWEARKSDNTRWDEDAYCGGNAAFVLDLLAQRIDGLDADQASTWRNEAKTIRETYVAELESRKSDSKWYFASLADGHFALDNYTQAGQYYAAASQAMEGDWERKTMFLQAVQLAGARGIPLTDPKVLAAIQPILGERTAAALAGFRPKTGLALSGGGFRAAFYHLGVLARLADIDALRHIETISTVSGGSIVGTHYFLKLKALIEKKGDDVAKEDYRQLVRELIDQFRAGVATNLRMRAFVSLRALWRMLFRLDYNRTLRLGELYDSTFYARILDKTATTLRDLIVSPTGATRAFSPRQDNWLRRAQVPILLINATRPRPLCRACSTRFHWLASMPSAMCSSLTAASMTTRVWIRCYRKAVR